MTRPKRGTLRDQKRRGQLMELTDGLPHNQALGVKAVLGAMQLEYRRGLICNTEQDGSYIFSKPSGRKEIESTIVCRVSVDGVIQPLSNEWVPNSWYHNS